MFKAVVFVAILAFAAASCPNSCSGHGRCGEWDKCTCFYRWMGNDCSQRMCKEGLAWVDGSQTNPHSWAECSNKGICNRESGECECYPEYDGAACERSVCPNDCSGHGQCEYIHELSDWDSTNWDYWKIQGCRCDGDWTGTDCSQRICPWGDDPLTIPTTDTLGDTYTFTVNQNGSHTFTAEMNIEIVDLNGVTHRSRPFNHSTKVTDGSALISDADFTELLLDIPAIKAVDNVAVAEVADDTTYTYSFRLVDPLRLTDVRVQWKDECTSAGCYPLRAPMFPPDNELVTDVAISIVAADTLAESAECSNRGLCNYDTGMCECFEGHFGLACQYQTILV